MNIITPTIGRKVWFWPNGSHLGVPAVAQPESQNHGQAMDATIVHVHSDRMVNLQVIDHVGSAWPVRSVFLQQEGDAAPHGKFVPWLASQSDMLADDWNRVA